jgi:hypothetical protein
MDASGPSEDDEILVSQVEMMSEPRLLTWFVLTLYVAELSPRRLPVSGGCGRRGEVVLALLARAQAVVDKVGEGLVAGL